MHTTLRALNSVQTPSALTDFDYRLISELQADGRMPYGALAAALGTSEATIQRRVQQLVDQGYFKIVGVVDPLRLGTGHAVLVGLQCDPAAIHTVADAVAAVPEMRFVSVVTGTYDIVCEFVAPDRLAMIDLLIARVGAIPGVRSVQTSRVLANSKTSFRWDALRRPHAANGHVTQMEDPSLRDEPLVLDDLDEGIVRLMEEDGRITYQDLATRLGTTISTARRRALRLLQSGYLTVIALGNPFRLGFDEVVLFWLRVDIAKTREVIQALETEPCIRYLSRMAGSVDVLAEAFFPDRAALLDFLDGPLSRISGIQNVALSFELVIRKRGFTLFE